MADREPLCSGGDARSDRVGARGRALHDEPARRGAALTGGDERGKHGVVHGLVQVGVAKHDRGILPAHLQREQLRLT